MPMARRGLPGALISCGWNRDEQRIGPSGRRPHATQRHRLLQIAPTNRQLVAGELHAVDLPDAVAQCDPQAVTHQTPAGDVVAELGRAVAADHDVTDLVAGARLPVPGESHGRLRGSENHRNDRQHFAHETNFSGIYSAFAAGSATTATWPSHCFIMRKVLAVVAVVLA